MDIDKINGTLAGQIAQKLDAADGKKDGKISASVWNDFVKDKGGKQIKNFISVENAMQSIASYANQAANVSQDGQKANDITAKWLSGTGNVDNSQGEPAKVDKNFPQKENPPQKDTNPPQNEDPKVATGVCKPQYANQTIKNEDTGKSEEYDENGYLKEEYDENGNTTKLILRKSDGTLEVYLEYKRDENGYNTQTIYRYPDGTLASYYESKYNEKGYNTQNIYRNPDGSVDSYEEFKHDKNGNGIERVIRNSDGSVDVYYKMKYDENGNFIERVRVNPDGSEVKSKIVYPTLD
jgi:hypothetical protein